MTKAERKPGTGRESEIGSTFKIKEQVSTRAIDALMANYRDAQQAFMELIDNAVDNRTDDKLLIRVRVTRNELAVFNQGGRGLDDQGLRNFFVWGYSPKTAGHIGFYGVGGKAAMGFLGRSMEVTCSPKGSDVEYKVSDPDWEAHEEDQWKDFDADVKKAANSDGYFRVKITNIKREVNAQALITKLGDIYAPLIRENKVEILVNGKGVEPLAIDYMQEDPALKPHHAKLQTKFGDWIYIKVGVLSEGQKVKPGIRCYYNGRLIEDEQFFGHPTPAQMPQASRLIGEAHFDYVPVTPNKSTFIHSSAQWEHSSRRIHDYLKDWIDKLSKLKMEGTSRVEGWEKKLALDVKRMFEHVLARTGLISKRDLPGESSGRLPPTPREEENQPTKTGRRQSPSEGKTPPDIGATVGETVKRWGALYRYDVVGMGSDSKRSEVVEEKGYHILKINSDFPLYQAAKKAGDDALKIYMAETSVMKICEIVTKGKSIEDYVEILNSLLREWGELFRSRIKDRRTPRK